MPGKRRFCRLLDRTDARTAKAELRMIVGLALSVLVTQPAFSQTHEDTVPSAMGLSAPLRLEPPTQNVRAFPRIRLGGGRELEYLGTLCANAKYKKTSRLTRVLESLGSTSQSTSVLDGDVAAQTVAPWWMLVPARRAVEDFEAPAHATKIVQPTSNLKTIRDAVVTFAYGPARVMATPHQVTTDSMLRVIISDPDLRAVHVLDPKGKSLFSILGEQTRRLRQPAGVAVDAEDNIYVTDSERGIVLVYNQHGQFVRYIGMFHGEAMFERPTGIAIDRKAGRLYLADTARNLVFLLDLQGNILQRVGKDRNGYGTGEFVSPTEIAVSDHEVVVLDAAASRIQVLDSDGKRKGLYHVLASNDGDGGLAVDNDGNIYISYVASSIIAMYQPNGTPLGTFGQPGSRIGEFRAPRGLWVDGNNRIYVSDTENARVQVFQVSVTETSRL